MSNQDSALWCVYCAGGQNICVVRVKPCGPCLHSFALFGSGSGPGFIASYALISFRLPGHAVKFERGNQKQRGTMLELTRRRFFFHRVHFLGGNNMLFYLFIFVMMNLIDNSIKDLAAN